MSTTYQVKRHVAEYLSIPVTQGMFPDEIVRVITQHIRSKHASDWLEEACHIWDMFVPLVNDSPSTKLYRELMLESQCVQEIDKFFTMLGPTPFLIIHRVTPLHSDQFAHSSGEASLPSRNVHPAATGD